MFFTGSRGPHGPDLQSPFGRKFQIPSSFLVLNCMLDSTGHHGLCQIKQRWNETSFPEQSVCKAKGVKQWSSLLGM